MKKAAVQYFDHADVVKRLDAALQPDDIMIGCGSGSAFLGGFRLWQPAAGRKPHK